MKALITLLLLLINHPNTYAQDNDRIQLSISYAAKFKHRKEKPQLYEDEKILEIGKNHSAFYSLWNKRRDEVKDSVLSRGGSYSDVLQAIGKLGYPLSKQNYTVYKNYPEKGKLTYTDKIFKNFKYTEDMEKPVWDIVQGDTVIYEYPCQKATTNFRGRTWNVWFTSSIPVSDGPWKLYGLPGLILKADDARGEFSFFCIGIRNGTAEEVKTPKGKFIECTPQKLDDMHIKSAKDPEAYLKNFGMGPAKSYGPDGKPLQYKEMHPVFLEFFSR